MTNHDSWANVHSIPKRFDERVVARRALIAAVVQHERRAARYRAWTYGACGFLVGVAASPTIIHFLRGVA